MSGNGKSTPSGACRDARLIAMHQALKFVLALALILACTYVAKFALQPDTKGVEVNSPMGSFATK
jgi:hypothetical protein|uniref:Uncharacterized protein n=1 Tax=uncultured prokaryote TaxID=198431 RepID=A0A0H5PYW7_9ZZZZ|nr:hypothetical protein [uncultured prokaryote]